MQYTGDTMMTEEIVFPAAIKEEHNVSQSFNLFKEKRITASFSTEDLTEMNGRGASLVLDFGRELAGGIRLITRSCDGTAQFHLTFGESYSEAVTPLHEKNTTNDHSPRDFTVTVSNLSDLSFGQTGFRFVKIELVSDTPVKLASVIAVNRTRRFDYEGSIVTDNEKINEILKTAAYTLKLCFQNGYIWDGVKRDRLVWSGDLHQEIVTSLYLYGSTENIPNVLELLREETETGAWINGIPSYSAWWVINLTDYCRISGDREFFEKHKDFAAGIFEKFDTHIDGNGNMDFGDPEEIMCFFLDWPTYRTQDALLGTAALICYAAGKFLEMRNCDSAVSVRNKLEKYLSQNAAAKQTAAFQVLAGRKDRENCRALMEEHGAGGFSTFMSYYILSALSLCSSRQTLALTEEYFGGMLSVGATTFWEDFDIAWLENCNTLETLPSDGQKDIHGDFGKYCYQNFRHSLCHGWSSGVVAFFVEHIIGLRVEDGYRKISVRPSPETLKFIHAKLPTPFGVLSIDIENGETRIDAPKEIVVVKSDFA